MTTTNGGAPTGASPQPPVFPCADKRPLTINGHLDASDDPAQIAAWQRRWPGCQWAMPTGAVSGLDVLDVDPRHGGDDALCDIEREHGPLPPTRSVTTPGGGQHYYFVHRDGLRCSTGRLGPGLDVRADGGYAVASAEPPGYVLDSEDAPVPSPRVGVARPARA